MTLVVTERLTLTTLTVAEAAAIVADDRVGRRWAPDFPIDGDRLVASLILEAGEDYDEDEPKSKSSSSGDKQQAGGVAFAQFKPTGPCFACGKTGHAYGNYPNVSQ